MIFTLPVPMRLLYVGPIKTFFTKGFPYLQAPCLNENKQFCIKIKICKEDWWIIHINDPFVQDCTTILIHGSHTTRTFNVWKYWYP